MPNTKRNMGHESHRSACFERHSGSPTAPYSLHREFGVSHWCWNQCKIYCWSVTPQKSVAFQCDLSRSMRCCSPLRLLWHMCRINLAQCILDFVWHRPRRFKSSTMFCGSGRYFFEVFTFGKELFPSCCCSWRLLGYLPTYRILFFWHVLWIKPIRRLPSITCFISSSLNDIANIISHHYNDASNTSLFTVVENPAIDIDANDSTSGT